MNTLVTSQYLPRLSSITKFFPGGLANQIEIFKSNFKLFYHEQLKRTVYVVRCISQLLTQWIRMHASIFLFQIRMKPEKVCRIIGACAILHNIALLRNEPLDADDAQQQEQPVNIPDFQGRQDGRNIREHIAREIFS